MCENLRLIISVATFRLLDYLHGHPWTTSHIALHQRLELLANLACTLASFNSSDEGDDRVTVFSHFLLPFL
jgi:hypothetical protein